MDRALINSFSNKISSHARYHLKLENTTVPLSVLHFSAQEQLSQTYNYRITFTCEADDLSAAQILNRTATLTFNPPQINTSGLPDTREPLRKIHGVIQTFSRLSRSADETRYEVELVPRLALLNNTHQHAIYQNLSAPQIVEKILRERHGFGGSDFWFRLHRQYPVREYVCQWAESDLDFIQRILAEVGIWYRFEMDARLKNDTTVFCDDQQYYQQIGVVPLQSPSGMNDNGVDAIWGLRQQHRIIPQSIREQDYNYRDALSNTQAQANIIPHDETVYGEVYRYGANYLSPGQSIDPETESGHFYARLQHERTLNRQHTITGVSTLATLLPGQLVDLGGDVPQELRAGLMITAIQIEKAGRDSHYQVNFTALPYSENFCFRPPTLPRPIIAGTVPARVSSGKVNDTYSWIDKMGRYRVKMDFDLANWKTGYESLWVRLARPYAGDTYGFHMPLLAGTEVAIAFEKGNPDLPYIAHVLHDSRHPDLVNQENNKRNIIRTPANNKFRMDDDRGREHIKLATEYGGKSQLNLGHLVDKTRRLRGEGFELRTDSWGAIRAGKGVFISADRQSQAQGDVLDMPRAKAQLSTALMEMRTLAASAQQAQALSANIERQQAFLQKRLDQLQQAVLLGSAPEGIALASGEDLQLSAGRNLTLTAGDQLDIGVMKKFTLAAGGMMSFFSRLGAKLFTAAGDIDIQAQGGNISTWSTGETHISSGKKMAITAQDELTLTCSGSYIRLKGGNVEIGGPGNLLIKNNGIKKQGAARAQAIMKSFAAESFDEKFILRHSITQEPIAN